MGETPQTPCQLQDDDIKIHISGGKLSLQNLIPTTPLRKEKIKVTNLGISTLGNVKTVKQNPLKIPKTRSKRVSQETIIFTSSGERKP